MENRCNEWNCPYNNKGVCTTNDDDKCREYFEKAENNA